MASYQVNSEELNDHCCPETPLQGSYYCSLHVSADSGVIEYDGFKFFSF